jgi:myo-inositol-1(or 4)-monophosphatase
MSDYALWLTTALEIADKVGALLRARWRQTHTIQIKGFRDIVTETDVECEQLIVTHLRAAFPDHAVTSEEAGADAHESGVRWFIDPVDGTTNFSRHNPNFSTSIAALEDGVPVVGVVVDPVRQHTFAARRGSGATLNGTPIHVSNVKDIAHVVFASDFPRNPQRRSEAWRNAGILLAHAQTMRATGSAALNMAYVAAGWVDLYMHLELYPWDQAAAALLVEEAGGALATVSGALWTPFCPDPLMAAAPELVTVCRQLLSNADEREDP